MNALAIAPLTRVEQVREAILHLIFHGELRPGDRLVESLLAKRFDVSQTTVNAALQELHAQGIVTKVLNRATTVTRYDREDLEALFSVRSILEPAAAAAAANNVERLGCEQLRRVCERMQIAARAQDLAGFLAADYEFHQEIYRLTDNRFLQQAGQSVAAAPFAHVLCNCLERVPRDYPSLVNDHLEVIEAMLAGSEKAARVVQQKVDAWLGWSLDTLDRRIAEGDPAGSKRE